MPSQAQISPAFVRFKKREGDGKLLAELMSKDEIPEEVQWFIREIGSSNTFVIS